MVVIRYYGRMQTCVVIAASHRWYLAVIFHHFPNLQATNVEIKDVDFNPEFITRMMPRLEWNALVETAQKVCHASS